MQSSSDREAREIASYTPIFQLESGSVLSCCERQPSHAAVPANLWLTPATVYLTPDGEHRSGVVLDAPHWHVVDLRFEEDAEGR